MVRVQAAEPMMDLFASRLGLPVTWPLTRTNFATYGWVTLGNTNLEFWAASNNSDLPPNTALPLFHGFALEPTDLKLNIAQLADRGVNCKPPRTYATRTAEGKEVSNFTNSVLLDVSGPLSCVFFCEWCVEGNIYPWAKGMNTQERRSTERKKLAAVNGGTLGVTGLMEIQASSPRHAKTREKWRTITGQDSGPIKLGNEVELSLRNGQEEKIEELVVGVADLDVSRKALDELGLLGESGDNECSLAAEACGGLRFRFRQQGLV